MADKKAKYITTTIPYVNADPHIGHALEFVQADFSARTWRLSGHPVFFSTGTDEHGQKIATEADKEGLTREAYTDKYAAEFSRLQSALNLSNDVFIRTTSPHHRQAAVAMWRRCDAVGDIYKKSYQGKYCVGCELFMKDSELTDGHCSNHPTLEPEEIAEENYFFKLSNYQKYLEEYLSQSGVILPEWRRQEALQFVQAGLEDISISRDSSRLDWGVPVPGDDTQVMYVWFDALTNYISTLGWPDDADKNFATFWEQGERNQVAGKDQIRFQSIIWQAMLKSADLPATDRVIYHGFINSGGQKMSKSIGNVISPYDLIERYGTEATRYILLRHVHPFDDSDLTMAKMDEHYTAGLVNGLGNLTARIMTLAETHLDTPPKEPETISDSVYTEALQAFNCQAALDRVWEKIGDLDEKITTTEPFKLIKSDRQAAIKIITELVLELYQIGYLLTSSMPETAEVIMTAVKTNKKPPHLFSRLEDKSVKK